MSTSSERALGTGGGSIAIRGFLVQALVALLEVVHSELLFSEITLEPAIGDEQFDFIWTEATTTHAVQVKSTAGVFTKAAVTRWASRLAAARTGEECRLVLVGRVHPSLECIDKIGNVRIEKRHLDIPALLHSAAHLLGRFAESQKLDAGTALQREMVVHALISKLEHYAIRSTPLTRSALIKLLREWIVETPSADRKVDVSAIINHAPIELAGRDNEMQRLAVLWSRAIHDETSRANVVSFIALGGEGKTSIVAKWIAALAREGWPGCDAAFAWSFHSQGTRKNSEPETDIFLKEALNFFGDESDKLFAASRASAPEKAKRLARVISRKRNLLVLDGLEPLQYSPTEPTAGELKEHGLAVLLKSLAAVNRGLCIVTSRISLTDLNTFRQTTAPEIRLLRLSREAGVQLLTSLGVHGSHRRYISAGDGGIMVNEFEKLVDDVKGHALTLMLLGGFLKRAYGGDIRQRDRIKFEAADAKLDGGHTFRVLAAYEQWLHADGRGHREVVVLRLLGLFDRPATAACIGALRSRSIPTLTEPLIGLRDEEWEWCLAGLENARLATIHRDVGGAIGSIDAHPLIREYFAHKLQSERPEAWKEAHACIFDHLLISAANRQQPTIEDLQPLFQAIGHGCAAGLAQRALSEVYENRIQMGNEKYALKKIGAISSTLSALAHFFDHPWAQLRKEVPAESEDRVFNEAALHLRAVGRLNDAVGPSRLSYEKILEKGDPVDTAVIAGNHAELLCVLGQVNEALRFAEEAISYADRTDDLEEQVYHRSVFAEVAIYSGNFLGASIRLEEAGHIQARREPEWPNLYSVPGFRLHMLLLLPVEDLAWKRALGIVLDDNRETLDITSAVFASATSALLPVHAKGWGFGIALHELTKAECSLFSRVISGALGSSNSRLPADPLPLFDRAISLCREAGIHSHLARGLRLRAWAHTWTGNMEAAKLDLNEAWEIAERGPMRLQLAEIHLFRARLFFREASYPWDSAKHDVTEARRYIEQSRFRRRDGELEDIETVLIAHQHHPK